MTDTTAPLAAHLTLTDTERDTVYRHNFKLFLADFVLFSVAMGLLSPTTVVPDFLRKLTDSEIVIGFSSQIFHIGFLLPQLLVARRLVRVQRKKWWFVGPNIPVRTVILTFAGIMAIFGTDYPQMLLVLFIVFYATAALGDGLVGVPWMDLAGSSLDDRRRARLFGWGNAIVGASVIAITPLLSRMLDAADFPRNYALVFGLAGTLFVISTLPGVFIRELPGGKPRATAPSMREYLPELGHVLRKDRAFRMMVIARTAATLFTLAAPYYIGLATERLGMSNNVAVSNFLLMHTLGVVIGSLLFARFGDKRTLEFIRALMALSLVNPVMALLATGVGPAPLYIGFLTSGIAEGSLGYGFVNWVIMRASADQRPTYSGLFSTVSAVSTLIAPFIGGGLVEVFDYEAAFIAALVFMSAGLYVTLYHMKPLRP